MSNVKPSLSFSLRKDYIKKHVAIMKLEDIAEECGVNIRTISRDIKEMKETGEFWEWLENEFWRLHRAGDVDNATKYREVAKLYGKQALTEKVEASGTIFQLEVWRPEEKRDAEGNDKVQSS